MFEKQLEAFEKFKKLKVGALFMQMGTGKTKIALELVNYNKVDLLVYIAPFSTLNNTKKEFEKWNFKKDYILIGYETIQSSDNKYLNLLKKMENKKCFVIADESIFIKNEETKRFKRLCEIRNKSEYALILNGTPLTKNEWDLYNQMYFLSPLILDMNRNQFLNTFFKRINYKKAGEKPNTFYKFSEVNADYLYKLIESYIFRSSLDFNKKETHDYKFIDVTNQLYNEEKANKIQEYSKNRKSELIIKMLNNLNHISSNSIEKNNELIKYCENKKIIVFCNYLSEIEYIKNNMKCLIIQGSTKNRKLILEEFKNGNIPLLITNGTGAYGLNLQFCDEIVYSSINFDYAKFEQSKYRIKRIGQNKNIKYTYFLSNLGINKLIIDNLENKKNLSNLIKEKIEKGEHDWEKYI